MTGRVALLCLKQKVCPQFLFLYCHNSISSGGRVFIYALLAIGLKLVVWLVPSLIGGAVSVSNIGVLLDRCIRAR